MSGVVYIVHCIDTEGPLYESIEATFERIREAFGFQFEPSRQLLQQLQRGEIDLQGKEKAVQMMLNPQFLSYYETWDTLDEMLRDAMSPNFRNQLLDSEGNGWVYNWFCVDHVGYDENPRRRDIGYHQIFDHYARLLCETHSEQDGLHFHFHPHAFLRHAHRSGTHWWAFSDTLGQTISRRIIDRAWFPTANRPGFHVNRPDSHWIMEQYIPFDYANQSVRISDTDRQQRRVMDGRFGDWRRAPLTWTPYHPSHDDYQTPGNCRRWIARCLNVGTRHRLLDEAEVRMAFKEAKNGQPAVLAFTNHDCRDLRPDVDQVRNLLNTVAPDYPGVKFVFSEAVTALRQALQLPFKPPCDLEVSIQKIDEQDRRLSIQTDTPAFGPQPWLAVKTTSGTYHYDNVDTHRPFHEWSFTFDQDTFPWNAVQKIGVAANNGYGATTVVRIDASTGDIDRRELHAEKQLVGV